MEQEKDRPSFDIDDLAADVDEDYGDEVFDLSMLGARAWLVKAPRFLSERWAEHAQAAGNGVQIGTMRVHDADVDGRRRIEIILPEAPGPSLAPAPLHYNLDIRNRVSENMFLFSEAAKPAVMANKESHTDDDVAGIGEARPGLLKGKAKARVARKPKAAGKVVHEATIQPIIDDSYRAVMRARTAKAAQPKRTIKQMTEDVGTLNRMASGVASGQVSTKFSGLTKNKAAKAVSDRFTRMPRSELLDLLFEGFKKYRYWGMKSLREATKQPEAYLKQVLVDIADLTRSGPYAGHWTLKESYRSLNASEAAVRLGNPGGGGVDRIKAEDAKIEEGSTVGDDDVDDCDDDENDEEMEMEEVIS